MSNYADLIERLQQESTEWDAAEARAGILGKSMAAQLQCRYAAQHAKRAADAISRLEREKAAILKVRDGYKSQMKFCDIEALGYFREFVRRIDEALSRTQEQTA